MFHHVRHKPSCINDSNHTPKTSGTTLGLPIDRITIQFIAVDVSWPKSPSVRQNLQSEDVINMLLGSVGRAEAPMTRIAVVLKIVWNSFMLYC